LDPDTNKSTLVTVEHNQKFVKQEYPEIKDLAKSFLTIVIGVFVASITFSEKIVATNTTSSLAKVILVLCWFMLLGSIVLTGCGSVYLAKCFNRALYNPSANISPLFKYARICYLSSGVCFGFGMSTMLAAGIISFLMPKESKKAY
jgi:hypothetical protein